MNHKLILGNGRLATEIKKQTGWSSLSRKENPKFDFNNPETYEEYISNPNINEIINCIAYTNTIDDTKEKHWETNYKSVIKLVELCNKYNKKLIHISSDYIYSNSTSKASELDIPVHLNNWYSYTKVLSDAYVEAMANNYLTIRTSFKVRPWIHDNAWADLIGNFDYVDVITEYIIKLINGNANGIFNVGTDIKTIYELAKETKTIIRPTFKDENPLHIRPKDVSMNIDKLLNFISQNDCY